MATDTDALVTTIRQSIAGARVAIRQTPLTGNQSQHLDDIELALGKLLAAYVNHTALARQAGWKAGRNAGLEEASTVAGEHGADGVAKAILGQRVP